MGLKYHLPRLQSPVCVCVGGGADAYWKISLFIFVFLTPPLGNQFSSNFLIPRAYKTYMESVMAGDDGRPHWLARKSCNYMTSTVDHCSNLLIGSCFTEGEVNELKDIQIQGVLEQLKTSIDAWDSDKCPPVRSN